MRGLAHNFSARVARPPDTGRGFTLVEIMIVVAIMGIVMTMSMPMVYKLWHKAPMIKAMRDVSEVLSRARAQAIMQNSMAEVVFHPRERTMQVSGAVSPSRPRRSEYDDFGAIAVAPPPPRVPAWPPPSTRPSPSRCSMST